MRGLRNAAALAAAAVAVTGALTSSPASAGAAPEKPGARPAVSASATTLVFDKNRSAPLKSKLSVYKGGKLLYTYRAGSGVGSTDDCASGRGWMPNGTWRIQLKSRKYNGKKIKGYAVWLQDMPCSKGTTKRKEMFIHSEMKRDGNQAGRRGLESQRWDGDRDYASNGCVKLSPPAIRNLFRHLDRLGWPTHLRVVS
ncbi:L,D-transpeptidase [Streptomyces seoulensis]|uniref:L,D-transpeptidase n=1 Tax=Streptomyces seoulensis TaxID=73044 RepID=A0A4P6U0J4_STRSO|nr:L,D-transpeptidase [Streptomyces seoulensis]